MKVTARVNGENPQLVQRMEQLGIQAKLVKGGVIVDLPSEGSSWTKKFRVPGEIAQAILLLDVEEKGGSWTSTGSAQIVCGLNGEKLRAYYMPRRGSLACETHAYFVTRGPVVTVTASHHRRDFGVKIERHFIVREGDMVSIKSDEVWDGQPEELPGIFAHYQSAVEAAVAKAGSYHCRSVYYVAQ
jgi:hypothetical protein